MKLRIAFMLLLILPGFTCLDAQKASGKLVLSGTVVDANQKPVQGAVIFIDNKKTETVTDYKGFYRLKVRPDATLITVFSLAGGMSEAPINRQSVIDFRLPGSVQGSPVTGNPEKDQVDIGYGKVNRKELTTTVGRIDGQNTKYASYTSIYDMIRGEVPGVQVSGKTITIQGPSSINLSSAPLLVVDGMVVESIDDIRPQMVKSIEILKGSAASIYGSRGTNGVILINLAGAEKKK